MILTISVLSVIYQCCGRELSQTIPAEASLCELAQVSLVTDTGLTESIEPTDIQALSDLSVLRNRYYSVDKKTGMSPTLFDINRLMATDVHINKAGTAPKVLIFHTHAHEAYADSGEDGGVIGAGERLKAELESYGISTLHVTESFDVVDGKMQILGAYERMEPYISKVLRDNPSIELVIDLHRDGVGENVRLVTDVNGEECAKVMFFNGLCQKLDADGVLRPTPDLTNPYVEQNLALSLKAQMCAGELYPGLTRKIYLNAYRYSLHLKPNSMLVELGAQTNTEDEVERSVHYLAEILYKTVFSE
jgi:stage II sporulation protein P